MKKNNFIKSLNVKDGIISYNDFDVDFNYSFEDQKYSFKEDMLQIKFGSRFILDVGWRPEFDMNGYFIVLAIQDEDWMDPILKLECKTLDELKEIIEKTSLLLSEKKDTENIPYRKVEYDFFEE